MRALIERLACAHDLTDAELLRLIEQRDGAAAEALFTHARTASKRHYGNRVFLRGLIEITNHCRNDCLYCGIRRSNGSVQRYRLEPDEILKCCAAGHAAGLRTFVLQGGEDTHFSDHVLCDIVAAIKARFPDCAVTLSMGERSEGSYRRLFAAGADRYLLRHEAACPDYYGQIHPAQMVHARRMACLAALKQIGYQTGCGFMVGAPGQTADHLVQDLRFIKTFRPHMVGIGPFVPHSDTPFGGQAAGSAQLTLYLLAIVRLLLPDVLLPATTALGTVEEDGQQRGILAGANVIMPNLSPPAAREKYMLYDNKRRSGSEAVEGTAELRARLAALGYSTQPARGDCARA